MQRSITLTLGFAVAILFASFTGRASAQDGPDLGELVELAIKHGDAHTLEKLFGNRVELSVLGSRKSYSRAQAKYVLEELFSNWNVQSYRRLSESRNRRSWFIESQVEMQRSSAQFRVFCRMRNTGGRWLIKELWITEKR